MTQRTIAAMSVAHDIAYAAGAFVTAPWWAWRLWRTGKWRTDWAGRFGRGEPLPPTAPGRRRLLLYAVSVGEINAIRQLVDLLDREHAGHVELVIGAATDTGFARACELFKGRHYVVRYPFDLTFAVRRFLDRVRPDAVALVELELWPNFAALCRRRGVPLVIVNGRMSRRSAARYRPLRPVMRWMFASVAAAAVQTPEYADRFAMMGVPAERVRVLDTMKWDTADIADDVPGAEAMAQALGIDRQRPLIVAGSTGPGEERLLIDTVRARCPAGTQLLLAPRKPERFDAVAALDPKIVRRTDPQAVARRGGAPDRTAPSVFLLDVMGQLRQAYALADVVVVGRSFNGLGGSDPIEPVALGRPTLIGPDHANFTDVVEALRQGGGIVVTREPGEAAAKLLAEPRQAAALARNGRAVIRSRQGSTARHAHLLLEVMGLAAAD